MRIASLIPSATEALFALGLGDSVAAVTHECDYPAEARRLPNLTRSVIAPGLEPAALDRAVRETAAAGNALYELDEEALAALDIDLIVTQALCAVCAVSFALGRLQALRRGSGLRRTVVAEEPNDRWPVADRWIAVALLPHQKRCLAATDQFC